MNMILEFTSPDDDDRFRAAWHGLDLIATLQDVDEHLRSSLKYRTDKPSADTRAAWEAMRWGGEGVVVVRRREFEDHVHPPIIRH